jgi:epoxyqueuosine reductase
MQMKQPQLKQTPHSPTPMLAKRWTAELRGWLDECASGVGFDVVGLAAVGSPDEPVAQLQSARFAAWVDAGHAGEMEYLKRRDEAGTLLRGTLQVALPWARTVVVCALNFNAEQPHSIDPAPSGTGWIARYAWTGHALDGGEIVPTDYHAEMLGRLRVIESGLLARADCTTRCYVDTGPILERGVASVAGVGWIGKNTCLINSRLGSWILLGVLVTSLPVEEAVVSLAAPDRCGSCTRCIDACPTGALLGAKSASAPRTMDATRCIAYLTIEKKGAIDASLRAAMGRQVFGCDICQDVCPWNRRNSTIERRAADSGTGNHQGMQPRSELVNPALEWLGAMDAREFKRWFKGSPLERTGRKRLLRNIAIAMGNSGERRFLERLEAWATSDDPVLAEAAEWARAQIL